MKEIVDFISSVNNYSDMKNKYYGDNILTAIKKSNFDNVRSIEITKGLGSLYQEHDKSTFFIRKGKNNQWLSLPKNKKIKIIEKK